MLVRFGPQRILFRRPSRICELMSPNRAPLLFLDPSTYRLLGYLHYRHQSLPTFNSTVVSSPSKVHRRRAWPRGSGDDVAQDGVEEHVIP